MSSHWSQLIRLLSDLSQIVLVSQCSWSPQCLQPLSWGHIPLCHRRCEGRRELIGNARAQQHMNLWDPHGIHQSPPELHSGWMSVCGAGRTRPATGGKCHFRQVNNEDSNNQSCRGFTQPMGRMSGTEIKQGSWPLTRPQTCRAPAACSSQEPPLCSQRWLGHQLEQDWVWWLSTHPALHHPSPCHSWAPAQDRPQHSKMSAACPSKVHRSREKIPMTCADRFLESSLCMYGCFRYDQAKFLLQTIQAPVQCPASVG